MTAPSPNHLTTRELPQALSHNTHTHTHMHAPIHIYAQHTRIFHLKHQSSLYLLQERGEHMRKLLPQASPWKGSYLTYWGWGDGGTAHHREQASDGKGCLFSRVLKMTLTERRGPPWKLCHGVHSVAKQASPQVRHGHGVGGVDRHG